MTHLFKRTLPIAVMIVIFTAGGALAQSCKSVTGRISPLQGCGFLCFQGTSTGNFNGSFQSMLGGIPEFISPTTFTASTTLTTKKGNIITQDAGVITDPLTTPHAAEILTVVGGTGDYAGASGHIFITGDYVPAFGQTTGQGSGELSGQICTP